MSGIRTNEPIEIDEDSVHAFFADRSHRYEENKPLVSVLYQDANPALAALRDRHEKETLIPLLGLTPKDSVLDIGCGIGRWASVLDGKVVRYHGTDFSERFVEIASKQFAENKEFSFQTLRAQDNTRELLESPPPFSLIIVSGLFIYLNDADCLRVVDNIGLSVSRSARILIREPIAVAERLTLSKVWSDELKSEYSAIYRTREEFLIMFSKLFSKWNFRIKAENNLLPPQLCNRNDTKQYYFLLSNM